MLRVHLGGPRARAVALVVGALLALSILAAVLATFDLKAHARWGFGLRRRRRLDACWVTGERTADDPQALVSHRYPWVGRVPVVLLVRAWRMSGQHARPTVCGTRKLPVQALKRQVSGRVIGRGAQQHTGLQIPGNGEADLVTSNFHTWEEGSDQSTRISQDCG
jgi:hypothetical protein